MKTTIKQLRSLIREAIKEDGSVMWGKIEDLDRSISSMDPNTVATHDYVDSDTGEIYLEKGQVAKKSHLHPDFVTPAWHRRWTKFDDDNNDLEDDDLDYDLDNSERQSRYDKAKAEFDAAVASFAESCKDYSADLTSDENDLEGIMPDLAESFFVQYPQWGQWARALDMDRTDMKSFVADMAYEAAR